MALGELEIRGETAGEINGFNNLVDNSFTWGPENFAGFYYDPENDLGTETLKLSLFSDYGNRLNVDESYGILYTTKAQDKDFKCDSWGSYKIIGFLTDGYFAGYNKGEDDASKLFYIESTDENSIYRKQLEKILIDDDTEMTITSGTPLKLEEGYELSIKSIDIDGEKLYLELTKEGTIVDSRVVSPSKEDATEVDKTYYYLSPRVGKQKNLVTIGVHFKNVFRGREQNLATVNGRWQISDTPINIETQIESNKMTLRYLNAYNGTIIIDNDEHPLTLRKNADSKLFSNIRIKTADSEQLRFYIYKPISDPGEYQIRGAVAGTMNGESNLVDNLFAWSPQNFPGFYYDLNNDLGTESLTLSISGDYGNLLRGDEPYGILYTTNAQEKEFECVPWGSYKIIGFLTDRCFAGYNKGKDDTSNLFYIESTDENSIYRKQLEKILIDDDTEMTITSGTPLKLEEGYELSIKSIDIDGEKVYLELTKDGDVVDSRVISPSKEDATDVDKTYYYINPRVGKQKNLVIIGVHFKNAFRGREQNLATVNGRWQISEEPIDVRYGEQYGLMTINSIDAKSGTIIMDNEDNAITLIKGKEKTIMPDLKISIVDNDTLRFYIYKQVLIFTEAAATLPSNDETGAESSLTNTKNDQDQFHNSGLVDSQDAVPADETEDSQETKDDTSESKVASVVQGIITSQISGNDPEAKTDLLIICLVFLFICSFLIWINKEKINNDTLPSYLKPFLLATFSMIVVFIAELIGTPFAVPTTVVFFGAFVLGIIIDKLLGNFLMIIAKIVANNALSAVISFYLNYFSLRWVLFEFPRTNRSNIEDVILQFVAIILLIVINTYMSEIIVVLLSKARSRLGFSEKSDNKYAFLLLILFAISEIARQNLFNDADFMIQIDFGAYQYIACFAAFAIILKVLFHKIHPLDNSAASISQSTENSNTLISTPNTQKTSLNMSFVLGWKGLFEKGKEMEQKNNYKNAIKFYREARAKCGSNQQDICKNIDQKIIECLKNIASSIDTQIGEKSWPIEIGNITLLGTDLTSYPEIVISIFIKNDKISSKKLNSKNFRIYEDDNDIREFSISFEKSALDIAFVFDDTSSMKYIIDIMKERTQGFVDRIKKHNTRFLLISFKDNVQMRTQWTFNSEEFKNGIKSLQASGGGDTPEASLDAVAYANSSGFRKDANKFIILITDAPSHHRDDGSIISKYTKEEVIREIRSTGSKIIVVSPKTPLDANYIDMKQIADETGGKHIDIQNANFSNIIAVISDIITGFYNISYRTSNDAAYKLIRVEYIGPKSELQGEIYFILNSDTRVS
jgi:S-layer protein (TIGR01567 family)